MGEKKLFQIDRIVCAACSGTGLYVGFAENNGAAVACHPCKGLGHTELRVEWEEFDERAERPNVRRVYECNPGIGIGAGQGHALEEFGGIPYADWREGKPFPRGTEMRRYTCPAWWFQCADYDKKPDWEDCQTLGVFSSCPHFGQKSECWVRWDKENPLTNPDQGETCQKKT